MAGRLLKGGAPFGFLVLARGASPGRIGAFLERLGDGLVERPTNARQVEGDGAQLSDSSLPRALEELLSDLEGFGDGGAEFPLKQEGNADLLDSGNGDLPALSLPTEREE